jgi:sRNA-binding carbon storage regulator CsrA
MLVIKRRAKQKITIEPVPGSDTSITVEEMFATSAIEIPLLEVGRNPVTVAIDAPTKLQIWRGDLPTDRAVQKDVA